MLIEIEQYKKQTIQYDDEIDRFVCDMTIEDRYKSTKRLSLKDVRKEIDSFIKHNLNFKPFRVFRVASYSNELKVLEIVGVRTDGLFLYKNLSKEYDKGLKQINFEKERKGGDKFFEYDAEVEKQKRFIEKEEEGYCDLIRKKEEALFKRLKKLDLTPYKAYTKALKSEE